MSVDRRSRTFSWEDPIAIRDAGSMMSGLEFIKAVFDGRLPPSPIAQTMDFTGAEAEEGRAVFIAEPGEFLYNPIGVVHGGFAMTILDSAMGCAVHTTLEAGVGYTTTDLQVRYIRAMDKDTGCVLADGRVLHAGRRTATAEGRLFAESDGRLIAHATTGCAIFR